LLSQINLKSISLVFLIILVSLLQVAIMPYFSFGQAIGNLILIFLIIFIFKKEYQKALIWVIVGGFILDLSLGIGFGIYIIPLAIIFVALFIFQEKILEIDIYIFILGATLVASILLDILTILMLYVYRQDLVIFSFWGILLKQAAINTIIMAIIYPIYYYFENKFYPERKIKLPESSI